MIESDPIGPPGAGAVVRKPGPSPREGAMTSSMRSAVVLGAAFAAACTGTIGENAPNGAPGAPGALPDTTIAPQGTMPTEIDPTDANAAKTCLPSVPAAPVRRLSYAEYQATTTDLLGTLKTGDTLLPRDPAAHGFENWSDLLNPSPLLVEQYGTAAIDAGLKVLGAMGALVPCTPKSAAEEKTCGATFVEQFAAKAFRRPLTTDEKADYTAFFETQRAKSDFKGAVQLTTEVLLQAPEFLYRLEMGDPMTATADRIQLTQYEIASRLSYLLVGSQPDKALLDAAASGLLDKADAREAQARRLLQDPHAGEMMVEFHRQWLDLDRIDREPKDPATYPTYDDALKGAIREESNRFVQKVIWQGPGTIAAFLTSNDTSVNAPLAKLYGASAPTTGWADVTLNPAERAGFLTRANFLTNRAHKLEGSPPLRSMFIRDRLLCMDPLVPPPDANLSEPKASMASAAMTNRQLFEARISPAACKACHTVINPMGYGLENYDAIGKFRTTDNGLPVDASGSVAGTDVDGPFTGGVELSQKLANSKTVAICVATNWFRYALGRDLAPADTCRLAKLNLALSDAKGNIRELLVSLAASPELIYRPPVGP
jgi:Protein of unknown function (DUF1592)/Protein of unknown function (DUF1588)/Protein of unknown function (DUF1595)/Protein of unknown function (DUF1585)/Protein of unknown function (DUF1587)